MGLAHTLSPQRTCVKCGWNGQKRPSIYLLNSHSFVAQFALEKRDYSSHLVPIPCPRPYILVHTLLGSDCPFGKELFSCGDLQPPASHLLDLLTAVAL